MISLRNLSLYRGSLCLLEQAELTVHAGQKLGLTGANGTGKSSLFALLRGQLIADAGDVRMPGGWRIAHVAQETPALSRPALDYVLDGDEELREVEAELAHAQQADAGEAIARAHGRLEAIGGYSARARAAEMLHGLGFGTADLERPVSRFSGGWRMRLNLAQALMCRSDLLLLDEPTNHLDLEAVLWLEQWLAAYPGTLLLISHDRDFLDAVVDGIVHLEHRRLNVYKGGYSEFERQRAERLAQQQALHERQQREVAHLQRFIDRFRAKATKAKAAQSRIKALERMERIAPAHVDSPFHFRFRPAPRAGNPLLQLEEAALGYGESPLLTGIRLSLAPGERVGLLGPNGAGKSTLIKCLAGELEPLAGSRSSAQGLRVGYFAQHQLEQLDSDASPLRHLQRLDERAQEQSLRDYLGGFGFHGEQADSPVAPFSGGEKARLVLALLVYQKPNLLLLDEPTNHLDLDMRQALASALAGFEGALVVVSHDRYLLTTTCEEYLLVEGGRVRAFDGDLDDYRDWLRQQRREQRQAEQPREKQEHSADARKLQRRLEAQRRQAAAPLKKRVEALDRELERSGAQLQALEEALADPTLYEAEGKVRLTELLKEQGELRQNQAELEEQWLEAQDALEQALS
ncbi:ATP-binding cassette domain-containing protein [Alkalilimnicola sp. S0819]|uniref:ATP-binding cassette domain-containing protein n=1 Tax=Alkalilimnicola sp. S0819 TaxID=2613922 RepID=UPI001261DF5E|nr:ATP-binding cassette domain-containing protein [Alkalilimnicola sp. S0819]KAB7628317.1 ATP-binding cassette domain-containing protein [Alkalilimnicola sp. S0819]MPQ15215.1 ATP-binding cassette domain-containing protein [Alkalilimnicola sp. S0819]